MERNYLSELQIDLRLLFSKERIAAEVSRLAGEISSDYAGREVLFVVVLNGALFFAADLMRAVQVPLQVDFVKLSSYVGTESSGQIAMRKDLDLSVLGRDVLVIEDVVDTGLTLDYLAAVLKGRGAKSVRVCALLDKKVNRQAQVSADYVGIECGGSFLVGYGLDIDERLRELSAIYEVVNSPSKGTA